MFQSKLIVNHKVVLYSSDDSSECYQICREQKHFHNFPCFVFAWSFVPRKWSHGAWLVRRWRQTRWCCTPRWKTSSPRQPVWGLEGRGGGCRAGGRSRQEGEQGGKEGRSRWPAGRRLRPLPRLATLTPCFSPGNAGFYVITFLLHRVSNRTTKNEAIHRVFVFVVKSLFWLVLDQR